MSAARLYTPELLGLAVELAEYPPLDTLPLHGESRSPTCGSTVAVDLELDEEGRIARLGMGVHACAVGQAAASLFARNAIGRDPAEIGAAGEAIAAWLEADGPDADPSAIWPGLSILLAARTYAARHGAILNPWKAAVLALSSAPAAS